MLTTIDRSTDAPLVGSFRTDPARLRCGAGISYIKIFQP
jgi:hypothetical protein